MRGLTPRETDRLTIGRNVTLTMNSDTLWLEPVPELRIEITSYHIGSSSTDQCTSRHLSWWMQAAWRLAHCSDRKIFSLGIYPRFAWIRIYVIFHRHKPNWSRNSSVSIVYTLRAGRQRNYGFASPQMQEIGKVQTGFGAYPVGTRGPFPGDKAAVV
jgi:hypothetical protein